MTAARAEQAPITAPALGMILFISSEVMFFAGLFAAYFTIRARAAAWPPAGVEALEVVLPAIATAVLVGSSFTAHRAVSAAERSDGGASMWLGITIAMGAVFLGAQGYEYSQLGFSVADHSYGTLFYAMTGFHALHVAGGLAALALVWVKNARGDLRGGHAGPAIAVGYYWHFVDVVWVALFSTLYLLG
ncbi:MAG TPA: cytochrome c oxidase subunit 3 [Actinomycetota bacterium]|nr:cytochrome c oxidase subunit 3 [Actinomycetota bacterium]